MPSHTEPSAVVVLVHGTWAPEAPWTCDDSKFRSKLKEQLGVPVRFCRFRWSGANSHTHRILAAAELRRCLKQSLSDDPSSSHFVVAHSHGGNVACYALKEPLLRSAISGVVCLATPFLHVEHNPLRRGLLFPLVLMYAVFPPAGVYTIAWLMRNGSSILTPTDTFVFWCLSAAAVALLVPVAMFMSALLRARPDRLVWRGLRRVVTDPAGVAHELALPTLGPERLLAVRISGDEAAGGLVASQFFAWLLREAWRPLTQLWDWLDRVYRRLLLYLGVAVTFLLMVGSLAGITEMVVLALYGLVGLATMVIALATYVVLVLLLLVHAPMGVDAMLGSLNLQTWAEPTPPDEAMVFHVIRGQSISSAKRKRQWRHSAIYDDPDVVRVVASWFLDRLRTGGRSLW